MSSYVYLKELRLLFEEFFDEFLYSNIQGYLSSSENIWKQQNFNFSCILY